MGSSDDSKKLLLRERIIELVIGGLVAVAVAYLTSTIATSSSTSKTSATIENLKGRLDNLQGVDVRIGVFQDQAQSDGCAGWALGSGTGVRKITRSINFDPPFTGQPDVLLSLTMLDADRGANTRILLYPSSISAHHFDLVVQTWADTHICGVQVQWFAIQR
ncbi:H-type lectin domain-containing protein [Segnochrobactraceae bacterium EtOH-i3]